MSKVRWGLGVEFIVAKNKATLFKWLWRYNNDVLAVWRAFLKMKYYPHNIGLVIKFTWPLSPIWNGICDTFNSMNDCSITLHKA
jgi:hypothetical protein